MQSQNASKNQQQKKPDPRAAAANADKSSDNYSGAFDDDYEF